MRIIIILILISLHIGVYANNETLDNKINKFCYENEKALDYEFGDENGNNGYRCSKILQAIYRFETGNLKSYVGNNIFNFKAPTCKKSWVEYYGCEIKNGFLTFPTKTDGIRFAVDRYYKYDYRKTITQIVSGGCYYNLNNEWVCFSGFTHTSEHWASYISYIKDYFNNN